MADHVITRDMPTHKRWDVDIEPVLTVRPGDTIAVETDDFAGGQVSRDSTHDDLLALDFNEIYPLAGPIFVEGAEPGDVLAIEFLEFELPDWGWALILPGFGLLPPGEFDRPYLKVFDLTTGDATVAGQSPELVGCAARDRFVLEPVDEVGVERPIEDARLVDIRGVHHAGIGRAAALRDREERGVLRVDEAPAVEPDPGLSALVNHVRRAPGSERRDRGFPV